MKTFFRVTLCRCLRVCLLALAGATTGVYASTDEAAPQILITNVNIFDGVQDKLVEDQGVLVDGSLIKAIGPNLPAGPDVQVIDGGGRTLMPGLIEMHTHLMFRYGVSAMRSEFDAQAAGAAAMETL